MQGSTDFVAAYAAGWLDPPAGVEVVLCPPWAYLDRVVGAFGGRGVRFGVQSTATEPAGALTGEHAAEMARDLGAEFVLVGHSERRRLLGETDDVVADKFQAALRAGLTPILCVGETLDQRRGGDAETAVRAQLDAVFERCGNAAWEHVVVAYEPVWAIGTGETATPPQAQTMHAAIRVHLEAAGGLLANTVRILYGGSIKAGNAPALFAQADIDGGLVGGASLDAGTFAAICCAIPQDAGKKSG